MNCRIFSIQYIFTGKNDVLSQSSGQLQLFESIAFDFKSTEHKNQIVDYNYDEYVVSYLILNFPDTQNTYDNYQPDTVVR